MFEQLSNEKLSIDETLTWLKKHQIDYFEELIFFPSWKQLKNSLAATASYHVGNQKELMKQFSDYRLVARTIDGDYLFANETQVLLFPRTRQPEDFRYFSDSFSNLLIKYANSSQSIIQLFE